MATFQEFVQIELPLRPAVLSNPVEETVLVRRGVGPRIYAPVDILEGEVLGKLGGAIVSVSNGAVTNQNFTVLANTTLILSTYGYGAYTSRKLVIDLTDGVNYEAFETLIVRTSVQATDHSIYGMVGSLSGYTFDVIDNTTTYDISITNNTANDMAVTMREVA